MGASLSGSACGHIALRLSELYRESLAWADHDRTSLERAPALLGRTGQAMQVAVRTGLLSAKLGASIASSVHRAT